MRILTVFSILAVLATAACTSQHLPPASSSADVDRLAAAGNGSAQLSEAASYCDSAPASDHGAQALKWLTAASKSEDKAIAMGALQWLGNYHLALFSDPDTYNAAKDKPRPFCTGTVRSKENTAKALVYLDKCVAEETPVEDARCYISLGHHYASVKDYAQAYYWYATGMAGDNIDDKTGEYPVRPLLAVEEKQIKQAQAKMHKEHKSLKNEPFEGPFENLVRNARFAASHLSKQQVAELDKKAILWYSTWVKKDYSDWVAKGDWRQKNNLVNP